MLKISRWALALSLLAACGEPATETPASPEEEAPTSGETVSFDLPKVEVTQTLGTFEGDVTDLAAIENEFLGFQGLIFAANGAAGVQMVTPGGVGRGSVALENAPDVPAALIAPTYAWTKEGNVLLGFPGTDSSTVQRATFEGDPAPASDAWTVGPNLADLCASGSLAVAVDGAGTAWLIDVTEPDGDESAVAQLAIEGATSCFGTASGLVVAHGNAASLVDAEGLRLAEIDPGADAIAATNEGYSSLRLDGEAIMIDGTAIVLNDAEGKTIRPQLIRVEGGNYGGVLRNGMVLVLDRENRLHLAAWSAMANAAGAPRVALSPRPLSAEDEPPFAIEGLPSDLTIETQGPGFEDVEPAGPPSSPER